MIRSSSLLLFLSSFTAASATRDELRLLALVPLTGKEPANGRACAAALKVVVEEANAQPNFLPGYKVNLIIKDEARNANNAPEAMFRFLGSQSELPNRTFLSPVVIGPSITCQYVTFAARFAYITEFSQFCAGPILVMRNILPNLYRVQMPGEYSVVAALLFIKRIELWRQISIFTYSLNVNEYTMAKKLDSMAVENGMEVVHYSSEADITQEMVEHAKFLGARVITMIYLQVAMCAKILCYSHMAGMRAPRYIFVGLVYCSFTPEKLINLPPGCTKTMLTEQLKITFWVGPSPLAVRNNGPTTLGYDLETFERLLEDKLVNEVASDMDQKHLCHDTALASLVALKNADRTLAERYNSSLRDFPNSPKLVASIVNESAINVSFHGLRIGPISYSPRFELSTEDIWIMEFTERGIRWLYKVPWFDDGSSETKKQLYNMSRYVFYANEPIEWQTNSGKPPKDLSYREIRFNRYPLVLMIVFAVLGSVGIVKTLVFIVILAKKSDKPHAHVAWRLPSLIGCVVIHSSAIFTAVGAFYVVSTPYCVIRLLLISVPVSFVNSLICLRMLCILKSGPYSTRMLGVNIARTANLENSGFGARFSSVMSHSVVTVIAPWQWKQSNNIARMISSLFALFSFVISIAWTFDGHSDFTMTIQQSADRFDEVADLYYVEVDAFCSSLYNLPWLAALLLPHFVLIISACFVIYFTMKGSQDLRHEVELQTGKIAVLNTLTLFTATLLIIIIIPNANLQTTVLVAAQLLYAGSVSVVLAFPILKDAESSVTPQRLSTAMHFRSSRTMRVINYSQARSQARQRIMEQRHVR